MTFEQPRLLIIDSYDSFTFNLAALCRLSIPNCMIYIIKNDEFTLDELLPYFSRFSAIIVGPGPGSPVNSQDIGIVKSLWKIKDEYVLPIFGVCLGLQSMSVEFGAHLQRLRVVKHGQVSHIQHEGTDLFSGVGTVRAVRYHSLHVRLAEDGDVQELAWADDEGENGHVVMAAKHKTRPFWAVQYHPESVRTEGGGTEVFRNFWRLAQAWTKQNGRKICPWDAAVKKILGHPWPHIQPHSPPPTPSQSIPSVATVVLHMPSLLVTAVCELFGVANELAPFVLLESAAQPGRFSIIASLMPASLQITHFVGDGFVRLKSGEINTCEDLGARDVWSWLATFMRARKAQGGMAENPFWGGLVGQLSYELGVHSLQVPLKTNTQSDTNLYPDVNLVFVERSVVLDSVTGNAYIQSLIPQDDEWITDTAAKLYEVSHRDVNTPSNATFQNALTSSPIVTLPDKARYISRINEAKEYLFAGDSYELCLTAQTKISLAEYSPVCSMTSSSWERYKSLRYNNPAPHSAYLRLHPTTMLSSSPERFLSFSRPPGSVCQLRPIKGTVRKGPGITRSVAEQALAGSTKEVAENLMIVDLIRHDLHGVVGEDVQVKQFCGVEEYETVWQLVSVIEGRLAKDTIPYLDPDSELGWEVLKRSLPPGSMTGAPKKRSVEILQSLEDHDRNVYSGVFGYWCVGGSGDWSVTIRSCFKFDERTEAEKTWPQRHGHSLRREEWSIGAGGAITALSDAESEWDEMVVKLQSVLRAFRASS